ncbi:alpha/beta hydrolase [Mesorhizobium sp. BH1-1-4]|uniref:alpha/beta hydrolase n=1 Tax=Mesorhizobium sp. BH1-1-4 TaxID=2876662 RepID=UPI001CD052FE|nr:alpha/beta hydrolase [Mesorhizobium sp. BH1-1-4]MBZ9994914.1 alpha/beta hydrolase [Mesorhizobium sp. BH1-1-4]
MWNSPDRHPIPPETRSAFHPITPEDKIAIAGLRTLVEPNKGKMQGIAAREIFDAIISHVVAPEDVTFRPGTVGGIAGWWCQPSDARPGQALLHLHGGWYNWGTAQAYRHFAGHIAKRAGAQAFVPDYRLAPEHPFPAAVLDARACYRGLIDSGLRSIALVGDSAGGGLALGLLSFVSRSASETRPVAAVALSAVTDLTLSGASWEDRAVADPYFTRSQAAELVYAYMAGHDPMDPLASPLHGDLAGLPPLLIHVGDDEVLLEDSRRYVARAIAAGVDAKLEVWEGMPHGFTSDVGRLSAATKALDTIGAFLSERLTAET